MSIFRSVTSCSFGLLIACFDSGGGVGDAGARDPELLGVWCSDAGYLNEGCRQCLQFLATGRYDIGFVCSFGDRMRASGTYSADGTTVALSHASGCANGDAGFSVMALEPSEYAIDGDTLSLAEGDTFARSTFEPRTCRE